MMEPDFDVIIAGAGAAGLMAAWELAMTGRRVAVLEARDRMGGRIHTMQDKQFQAPIELGAEFIHGKLKLTRLLLEKAGIAWHRTGGEILQVRDKEICEQDGFIEDYSDLEKKFKELEKDIPVSSFLENHLGEDKYEQLRFTLKNYVEGYYAADIEKASSFALRDELSTSSEIQYRAEGGYQKLVEWLYTHCLEQQVRFFLSEPVKQVHWQKNFIKVESRDKIFTARKILVTVPIGVLQSESIRFYPALKQKMAAARTLGFGPVIKTLLQFDEVFWKHREYTRGKEAGKLGFIFSESRIPTWWTQYPKETALLTGWSGGPHAQELKDCSQTEITEIALQSLSEIFGIPLAELSRRLTGAQVANWVTDPFTCGGYSYDVVNGNEAKSVLLQPDEDTIYFAGEGLFQGPEIGTVEAALNSGRDSAHRMIAAFKN